MEVRAGLLISNLLLGGAGSRCVMMTSSLASSLLSLPSVRMAETIRIASIVLPKLMRIAVMVSPLTIALGHL